VYHSSTGHAALIVPRIWRYQHARNRSQRRASSTDSTTRTSENVIGSIVRPLRGLQILFIALQGGGAGDTGSQQSVEYEHRPTVHLILPPYLHVVTVQTVAHRRLCHVSETVISRVVSLNIVLHVCTAVLGNIICLPDYFCLHCSTQ